MTKPKRRKRVTRPAAVAKPKPKRYSPPDCSSCKGTRAELGVKGEFTEVETVKRTTGLIVRYLRCRYCGDTSKDVERVKTP